MWPFKKKSAEHALRELVDGLSQAMGQNLISVVVYGSKASGEYQENRSDVNVFLLVQDASWQTFGLMAPSIQTWVKAGHPAPVALQQRELQVYADSLPIEFLDMQDHHKVVFGSNPLEGLAVNRSHLRSQCAQELAVKQLLLRQGVIRTHGDPKGLRRLILGSLPSILTLFRAALRLEAEVPKGNKMAAAKELAKRVGFDGEGLERLWEVHMRRQTDNLDDLGRQYLDAIERVLAHVHKS